MKSDLSLGQRILVNSCAILAGITALTGCASATNEEMVVTYQTKITTEIGEGAEIVEYLKPFYGPDLCAADINGDGKVLEHTEYIVRCEEGLKHGQNGGNRVLLGCYWQKPSILVPREQSIEMVFCVTGHYGLEDTKVYGFENYQERQE